MFLQYRQVLLYQEIKIYAYGLETIGKVGLKNVAGAKNEKCPKSMNAIAVLFFHDRFQVPNADVDDFLIAFSVDVYIGNPPVPFSLTRQAIIAVVIDI